MMLSKVLNGKRAEADATGAGNPNLTAFFGKTKRKGEKGKPLACPAGAAGAAHVASAASAALCCCFCKTFSSYALVSLLRRQMDVFSRLDLKSVVEPGMGRMNVELVLQLLHLMPRVQSSLTITKGSKLFYQQR